MRAFTPKQSQRQEQAPSVPSRGSLVPESANALGISHLVDLARISILPPRLMRAATPNPLADRITHVTQQAQMGRQFVQREKKPGVTPHVTVPRLVHFKIALSREEFIAYVNRELQLDPNTKWSYVKEHYARSESPVRVWVSASKLIKQRSTATAAEVGIDVDESDRLEGAAERVEELSGLSSDTKRDLYAEVDRRYWEDQGLPRNTKIIDPIKQAGQVALWNQIRDEVLAQREFVMNLPPKVQTILHYGEGGIIVAASDYEQIVRIAAKIQALGDADIENYQRQAKPGWSLDQLESGLNQFKAVKEAAAAKIAALMGMTAVGHDDTDTAAAKVDETTLFYLSVADRIALIDEIVHGSTVYDEDEETLIRLLRTTPSADCKALIEQLKSNGAELLDALHDKINFADNKDLHDAFRIVLLQSIGEVEASAKMENATILPWSDPGLIKGIYTKRYTYVAQLTPEGKVAVAYASLFESRTFLFEADEIVGLEFQTDDELGAEGKTAYMPAYNLLFMDSEQFKRDLGRALDVALLAAGGVGLVAKGARLAKALAALDLLVGTTALVIDSYRAEIASTPAGKEFLRVWDITQTLIGVYGITRVVLKLPSAFRNLKETYQKFSRTKSIDPAHEKEISESVDALIEQADNAATDPKLGKAGAELSPQEAAGERAPQSHIEPPKDIESPVVAQEGTKPLPAAESSVEMLPVFGQDVERFRRFAAFFGEDLFRLRRVIDPKRFHNVKDIVGEIEKMMAEFGSAKKVERVLELSEDVAHNNQISLASIQEARVGLDLETRGLLAPPITRYPGTAAEFFDGKGQMWDVKGFWSGEGKGGYKLLPSMGKIEEELKATENVIIDTTKMNADDIAELRKAVRARGLDVGPEPQVIWYP